MTVSSGRVCCTRVGGNSEFYALQLNRNIGLISGAKIISQLFVIYCCEKLSSAGAKDKCCFEILNWFCTFRTHCQTRV